MAQTDLRFTFEVTQDNEENSSPIQLDVISFELEEALNETFCLELELSSFNDSLPFDQILDNPALFTIHQGGVPVRYIHGLVSHFEQGKTGARRTRYRAVVEPSLARLGLVSDWRIFQQTPVQEILSAVFKANRIDNFEINAQLEHVAREYCVQPGVLDFDFIQYLAAEEGFVYRIDSTQNNHRLLLTDIVQTFGAKDGTITYNPAPGGDRQVPALRSFVYTQRVHTAQRTFRDYTFKNPRYAQAHSEYGKSMPAQSTSYEQYDYPGRYKQDAVGKPFTTTSIQSLRNDAVTATCIGDDARLEIGVAFQLQGHSREDLNVYWRPVKIFHAGTQNTAAEEDAADATQSTSYEQTATLVLATENWKADIPEPHKIEGPLIGHISGPSGEEIYVDEFGRCKVQFPWDRHGEANEHSSCWIRVAQNWAGAGWGHIAIPRIGQEVIVEFLNADQDQPIITGRTYDAMHPTPYKLPALKTQQTTKSKEHKGSGYSELLIDDTTGEIKTQLHTTHQTTQLTMGHLTHPRKDDGSGEHRGDGFEVRTDAHGAIRAGQGLYISTDKRDKAEGKQLDLQEAIAQMEHALNIAKEMQKAHSTAQTRENDTQNQEQQFNEVYQELLKPGMLLSSPEGIAATSPKSIQMSTGENMTVTTNKSTDISAWKDVRIGAKDNLSLLAVEDELKVVANKGEMKIQAQHNQMQIASQKGMKVISTEDRIEIAAEKEILLTSGGGYIRIADGNIYLHAPGIIDHKAAAYPFGTPASMGYEMPSFRKAFIGASKTDPYNLTFLLTDDDGVPYANTPYIAIFEDGSTTKGYTNKEGYTQKFISDKQEKVSIHLLPNDSLLTNETIKKNNLRFHFVNDAGTPYAHTTYTATRADGNTEGKTDENGYTETFYSDEPEEISVHLHL